MLYRGNDRARLARRAEIARQANVPLIAVNDVLYHHPDRRELQDVLTCIREHLTIDQAGRRLAVNAERYLKPPSEMTRLFCDAPEAIAETSALDRALTFSLNELRYEYPDEMRAGFATPQDALAHLAWEGAAARYPDGIPDSVRQSLEHELALIAKLNYAPYFLTVHHIVGYARSQNILCQGRGSAANSAVCYVLGVTSIDPVRQGLLFERFVSEERREIPSPGPPAWMRARLDLAFMAVAVVVGAITYLTGGYKPTPVEGQSVSLSFYILLAPWVAIFPSVAIATLIVGLNLLADGIKQATVA